MCCFVHYFEDFVPRLPSQNDWDGYVKLTAKLGSKTQIVGDDFFVTNPERFRKGIAMKACNAILIKVNQIGTVTETLECIKLAQQNGLSLVPKPHPFCYGCGLY